MAFKFLLKHTPETKGLFTRREGYPNKRVNHSWRAKDSPGLLVNFHITLQPVTI